VPFHGSMFRHFADSVWTDFPISGVSLLRFLFNIGLILF